MVPQWRTPSYFGFMVVAWCKTCNSASNYVTGCGLFSWFMMTIPLLISFRTIFSLALTALTQRHASSSATVWSTEDRFTWIDLIETNLKFFVLSGPSKHTWFNLPTPDLTMPERTSPTPSTTKLSLISNSKGYFSSSSRGRVGTVNLEMKEIRISNPDLLTLETGNIGQTDPPGINSTVFASSFNEDICT